MIDNDQQTENTETGGVGLAWRILIGVIAIVLIGVIIFPFIRPQNGDNASSLDPVSPVGTPNTIASAAPLQADPNSAKEQFELGNAYYEAGDWEQAVAAYQRVVELEPDYQAAYANLGVTYYQQQKFDLAASQYQKALELNPEDGDVLYNLGALYLQQAMSQGEQPDPDLINQAVTHLQQAMEISPDLAEPYFTLGVAYFALEQHEKAIETFEAFLARQPDSPSQARDEAERYLEILRNQ